MLPLYEFQDDLLVTQLSKHVFSLTSNVKFVHMSFLLSKVHISLQFMRHAVSACRLLLGLISAIQLRASILPTTQGD